MMAYASIFNYSGRMEGMYDGMLQYSGRDAIYDGIYRRGEALSTMVCSNIQGRGAIYDGICFNIQGEGAL